MLNCFVSRPAGRQAAACRYKFGTQIASCLFPRHALQGAAKQLATLPKVQALLRVPHVRTDPGAWASGIAVMLDSIFPPEHASKDPKKVPFPLLIWKA